MKKAKLGLLAAMLAGAAQPAVARESLGLYATWGAFRDPLIPRCYAIAMADPSQTARDYQPYAAIGTWPKRAMRNQLHFRVSRKLAADAPIVLTIGSERIVLIGGGGDAWPQNERDNAAIIAAMRVADAMTVHARDAHGIPFANRYTLPGAASAMDAAAIGCAKVQ